MAVQLADGAGARGAPGILRRDSLLTNQVGYLAGQDVHLGRKVVTGVAEGEYELPIPDRSSASVSARRFGEEYTQEELARDDAALARHLGNPPGYSDTALTEVEYNYLLAETRQLVKFAREHPAKPQNFLLAPLLQRAVDADDRLGNGVAGLYRIHELRDSDRSGIDRRKTFGQCPSFSEDDRTQFMGSWLADRTDGGSDGITQTAKVGFQIEARGEIAGFEVFADSGSRESRSKILERMVQRGPSPWKIQVPENSKLGEYFARLAGDWRTGQIEGNHSLGVLGEAVVKACEELHGLEMERDFDLTHMLIPRARRRAGERWWHNGEHLKPDPQSKDGSGFLWEGHAILGVRGHSYTLKELQESLALVNLVVKVELKASISTVRLT